MDLQEKIRSLPDAPGVYLFKDARGDLLYIGKALSLRKRVQSYFTDRDFGYDAERLGAMLGQIADVEFLLTANELEALILESNLIKQRRPRYNIVLRDDKHYPFIRLNLKDPFPALQVSRRIKNDGALYFGPYVPAGTMWDLLALLNRTFPLRTCRNIAGRTLCLEYHLGRCLGPCEGLVTQAEYAEIVQKVRLVLEGKDQEVIQQLERQMHEAAERLQYERAAKLRNQIASLRHATENQRVISARGEDQDVFGLVQEGNELHIQLLVVRGGRLIGQDSFAFEAGTQPTSGHRPAPLRHAVRGGVGWVPPEGAGGVLGSLLAQYYLGARHIPKTILTSHLPAEVDLLASMLSARARHPVEIRVPERGPKARLVEMAVGNARALLAQSLTSTAAREQAMVEVEHALGLPCLPRRIECTDISNISGVLAVGSLVTFVDGQPRRQEYKRFRIRTVLGADDYAMVREVLGRRFGKKDWPLPDLLLIDGGRGQLNAGILAAKEAGLTDLPLASLAKEEELVFRPDAPEPIRLPDGSRGKHLLQQVRDETHRFALMYHRSLRGKSGLRSVLDEVPGIGARRKRLLLQRFGSLKRLRAASVEELRTVGGLPQRVAEAAHHLLSSAGEKPQPQMNTD
ncbi:MAG: excinuclease ABC subunit C [candidate division NC10 bacterium]|nr:excinuclease ABC subunit C [candidate division NC10 bacterium]